MSLYEIGLRIRPVVFDNGRVLGRFHYRDAMLSDTVLTIRSHNNSFFEDDECEVII